MEQYLTSALWFALGIVWGGFAGFWYGTKFGAKKILNLFDDRPDQVVDAYKANGKKVFG